METLRFSTDGPKRSNCFRKKSHALEWIKQYMRVEMVPVQAVVGEETISSNGPSESDTYSGRESMFGAIFCQKAIHVKSSKSGNK
jgi:hypothetical protein